MLKMLKFVNNYNNAIIAIIANEISQNSRLVMEKHSFKFYVINFENNGCCRLKKLLNFNTETSLKNSTFVKNQTFLFWSLDIKKFKIFFIRIITTFFFK